MLSVRINTREAKLSIGNRPSNWDIKLLEQLRECKTLRGSDGKKWTVTVTDYRFS